MLGKQWRKKKKISSCNVNVQGCAAFECIPQPCVTSLLCVFFFFFFFFFYLAAHVILKDGERGSVLAVMLCVGGRDAKVTRSGVVVVRTFSLARVWE